jgi:hypothetical protein
VPLAGSDDVDVLLGQCGDEKVGGAPVGGVAAPFDELLLLQCPKGGAEVAAANP